MTEKLTTEEVPVNQEESETDSPQIINITKGYSRDHRPDLNQAILQLIVENQAGIPLLSTHPQVFMYFDYENDCFYSLYF